MPALSFPSSGGLSSTDDARLSRVEATVPRKVAGGTLYSPSGVSIPASSAVLSDGKISPSGGIATVGSTFPFVVQGQFNFSWDGFALTIYWDGTNGSQPFVIRRADSSTFSVPRGSMKITSLQAKTKYSFAPFSVVAQPQTVAFAVGDTGSPRFAFSPNASPVLIAQASQTQRLTVNERLTDGFIEFTTGDAGTQASGSGAAPAPSPYTGNQYNDNRPNDVN